ncbi:hypothetical protein TEA_015023 [Camellia sinensis var. sinensis]|uniref:Uncharacterized protein n=1 Tax=Camellia sinensis var. sinensis TaxID=542762 RepID=A0A4S4EXF8_CAMSN|nr:hypothetical protein TEA_015023 [Camellia sinensis var. sinensis]
MELLHCKGKRVKNVYCKGNVPKFPRTNVWDPYKRLGISTDASEEEIWGSRNFLLDQYARHERSAEAIEAAFEKILMASFINRKKTKINLKSRLKKKVEESPPWVKNLLSFVEVPPTVIILRRLFLFAFMGGWSIMNSAESGPAFQEQHLRCAKCARRFRKARERARVCWKTLERGGRVRSGLEDSGMWKNLGESSRVWMVWNILAYPGKVAISLAACIYFLNDKTKSLARASIIGFGSLVVGWVCGSFLVPMIPSVVIHPTWTLELLTSLVAYVFLFLGCTFLK